MAIYIYSEVRKSQPRKWPTRTRGMGEKTFFLNDGSIHDSAGRGESEESFTELLVRRNEGSARLMPFAPNPPTDAFSIREIWIRYYIKVGR